MDFLQSGPAETTGYMILGFAVIFGSLALHLFSLKARRKNLERDLEALNEFKK
ncbi:MAG: hypothetical protein O3B43_00530 [Chloroflexi bacterium]|nr:hypothetical protein [Chloroflexota bacterium]